MGLFLQPGARTGPADHKTDTRQTYEDIHIYMNRHLLSLPEDIYSVMKR